jgi:8-oxo-dGTP pyrophosphatase MutT (NUDIX family)
VRPAARVVLIDGDDRTLLFCWEDERLEARRLWITPGGGVRPGETFEAAARRELWEETGIEAAPGPCVWDRRHTHRFGTHWIQAHERFFVVRVPVAEVRNENWEIYEHAAIAEHRLWTLDEIMSSDEWFVPRHFGELLSPLLRGELPAEPIEIGA